MHTRTQTPYLLTVGPLTNQNDLHVADAHLRNDTFISSSVVKFYWFQHKLMEQHL